MKTDSAAPIEVRLTSIREIATGIHSFEFQGEQGESLPGFDPGAHIDLYLPGMVRSYSLCNKSDGRRYVIAVNENSASRGGSRFMHRTLRVGSPLKVSVPKNNFRMDERATHSVFIAGGIGITPIFSMIQKLAEAGSSWELHYACRSSSAAAFVEDVRILAIGSASKFNTAFGQTAEDRLSIDAIVKAAPVGSHFYCCGPPGMLSGFEAAAGLVPDEFLHTEYFAAPAAVEKAGGFSVRLVRSGRTVSIDDGCTILDKLLAIDVDVPNSCREGVCGMCETRVIKGIPDHRDLVLSKSEKAANNVMMICCSRSLSEEIVLDL